jgi:aspartate/methionine/tyrosine aminotransferase
MFHPTRYIEWARRRFGQVRYDLATSGIPTVPAEAWPAPPAGLPCAEAWARARAAIARYNDVPEGEAIAALGTTHATWLALATLLAPGDAVLVEDPAYEPLLRTAEGVGAEVIRFARPAESGFALDPDRVRRAWTARTRVVLVSHLHNPSGCRATNEALSAVAKDAADRGAFLVVDEVYSPFDALVDAAGVFRGSARKVAPNVVAVGSLTKCYGLGPERLGWILAPEEIIARAEITMTCSAGALPLSHAQRNEAALAHVPVLAERTRALLGAKRQHVASWAAAHDVRYSAPSEGLFGFVTLPGRGDLFPEIERAAEEHGVLVAAGGFFGVPDGFRLAWSLPEADLDEGLARLTAALKIPRR